MLLYWFALQIFSGFGSIGYSNVSRGGVAWFAHSGGFIAGIALIYVLRTRQRFESRKDLQW
jgi:membrane associated rhomboid family serine protease